jgi:uncharacterized protein YecT (DUF1311 family)
MRLYCVSIVLVVLSSLSGAASVEQSQIDMNRAAADELASAEVQMTRALDELGAKAHGNPDIVRSLEKAQATWRAYRDAQIDALWPLRVQGEGSVYPVCITEAKSRLTRARVSELRAMLSHDEGDVCSSQWSQ